MTVVDPLNITKEFNSILADPVLATDVTTKIILHRDLWAQAHVVHVYIFWCGMFSNIEPVA